MHFTCRSFIGSQGQEYWSQYWENEPDDFKLAGKRGHLFGLINLTIKDGDEEAKERGHRLIEAISDFYFRENSETEIDKIISKTAKWLENKIEGKLVLAIVAGKQLWLLAVGQIGAIVNRDKSVSQILMSKKGQTRLVSGQIKNDDRLLLATEEFLESVGTEKIKQALANRELTTIEEDLMASMVSCSNQTNLAAVIIQMIFDENDNEIQSTEPEVKLPLLPKKRIKIEILPLTIRKIRGRKWLRGTVLIGLLLLGWWGWRDGQEKKYQKIKSQINKQLDNARVVQNLNPESMANLAKEAQKELAKLKAIKIHTAETKTIEEEINRLLSPSGQEGSFQPEVVFDLSTVVRGNYSRMTFSGSQVIVMDRTNGKVETIDIKQKSLKELIRDEEIKKLEGIFSDNNRLYGYRLGIIENISEGGLTVVANWGTEIEKMVAAEGWGKGFYILTENSIYKVDSRGKAQNWLIDKEGFGEKARSFVINGKIWVLSDRGEISAWYRGKRESKIKPIQSFGQVRDLRGAENGQYLAYIAEEKMVVVYKKTGEFVANYNFSPRKIKDITIDTQTGNILILTDDQKIEKIDSPLQ